MSAALPPPAPPVTRDGKSNAPAVTRDGQSNAPVVTTVEIPALSTLLMLAICVVVVAALDLAREVLIPITLAVLLSFVLAPLASLLRRLRLGRVVSVLMAVIIALGLMLAIGGLIGTQIADLIGEVPRYQHTVEKKLQTARDMTIGRLNGLVRSLGKQIDPSGTPAPDTSRGDATPGRPAPLPVEVHQPDPSPVELAERVLSPIVGPLSTTAIVFIVAIFILLQREDLRDRLIRLFGSSDLHRTTLAMNDAAKRLSRYFLAQLAVNAGFGIVIAVGLLVIGVPSAVLWGVLAGLLRFLPYLGAPLAAVMPMALAAAVDPGWSMVLWTAAMFFVVEATLGQVLEPMLYGRSTGLSPVSVVVAATFWTWLWGPIGLIMSTPLTLCLVVLGRHVQRLEFLEVLLGDRPALTPVESFYQRMLAGDAAEAYAQAEDVLRGRSLSSYYDEVAVKGLRLAADDRQRGVLTDRQVLRIQGAFDTLVADLDTHDDADPEEAPPPEEQVVADRPEQALPKPVPPAAQAPAQTLLAPVWRGDGAVLCLPGRGPLDEAAASMLAQLLAKHGLGARVLTSAEAAPQRLAELDLSRTAMVCICYLRTEGMPVTRSLIRRLRQGGPQTQIMVGLWPAGEAIAEDTRRRATIGANHCVGTFHEAVEICVGLATASVDAAAAAPAAPPADTPLLVPAAAG